MNIAFFLHPKNTLSYIYDCNSARQGLEKMRAGGFSAIPVISQDGKYRGTISEGDFLWHITSGKDIIDINCLNNTKITDLLKSDKYPPVLITSSVDELLNRVTNQNFVPVTDDFGIFMGIVTRKDIILYLCQKK